ncbi:hypothetical protein CSQ94_25285 [Janthinobacterium sp. BJB312]|nr:hypothetical protein CSQ94_25285 [Janthinobacterium sp. BJB312]
MALFATRLALHTRPHKIGPFHAVRLPLCLLPHDESHIGKTRTVRLDGFLALGCIDKQGHHLTYLVFILGDQLAKASQAFTAAYRHRMRM